MSMTLHDHEIPIWLDAMVTVHAMACSTDSQSATKQPLRDLLELCRAHPEQVVRDVAAS